jgi:hypothetical protein
VCDTSHSDGVGQNFYDCNPLDTYSAGSALEACTAYAVSLGKTAAYCSDGWGCEANTSLDEACYTPQADGSTCSTYCWVYSGNSEIGWVTDCSDCQTEVSTWD